MTHPKSRPKVLHSKTLHTLDGEGGTPRKRRTSNQQTHRQVEEFHKPFYYDEIVEGGHAADANLKEQAKTWAEQYTYLTRKLMD